MSTCLAPACPSPRLDLGTFAYLCLDHALSMVPISRNAPERPDLAGRCWGAAMTCSAPATAVTAHGGYCAEHLPAQPRPVVVEPDVEDERSSQVAVLGVLNAFTGARLESSRANLWASRAYGDREGVEVTPSRHYASSPSRAVTVELDDERVPRNARSMAKAKGWSVSLRYVEDMEDSSLLLKAWRGAFLLVARWEDGKFATAWLQHSRGMPMRLQARQASAFLKAAP